jgi:glutathione S-transferase
MSKLKLVIGNKRYSSWSLRPWLLLKYANIEFEEIKIYLFKENFKEKILQYSPSGKVPILIDGDISVWESLAICEYLAEKFPENNFWPKERAAKAMARSISSEMHAGFTNLRQSLPMNCVKKRSLKDIPEAAQKDIDRIIQIWETCRGIYKAEGDFLFGEFTIADCMYAPVATRFLTYGVQLPKLAEDYKNAILNMEAMKAWVKDAQVEKELIEQYEK